MTILSKLFFFFSEKVKYLFNILKRYFAIKMYIDTPGLVCIFLTFLLRAFYSLYIIYERVQITP